MIFDAIMIEVNDLKCQLNLSDVHAAGPKSLNWTDLVLVRVQQACKRAAAAATQLINSSSVAAKSNSNAATQSKMSARARVVSSKTIPRIVQALRAAALMSPNDDPTPIQLALVSAAHEMIQVRFCELWWH